MKVSTRKWMMGFVIFGLCGCAQAPTEKDEVPGQTERKNFGKGLSSQELESLSKEVMEEREVGRLMAAKLLGHFGAYHQNRAALEYLNLVGKYIASQVGRPELEWRFGILDSEEINAFACPGGYVLVTRGLLTAVSSEMELATVLSHEIAHINEKHMYNEIRPKRDVSTGETLTRILSRGSSDLGANMAKLVEAGIKKMLEQGYDKEKEYEADGYGVMFAAQVGYSPAALQSFISKLSKNSTEWKDSKTHPPYEERLKKLAEFIAQNGLTGSVKNDTKALEQRFARNLASFGK